MKTTNLNTIAAAMTINGKPLFGYSNTFDRIHTINNVYGLVYVGDELSHYINVHYMHLDRKLTQDERAIVDELDAELDMICETVETIDAIWDEYGTDHEITSADYFDFC